MQVPGTKASQRDKEDDQKKFAERQLNRKLDFLKLREPCDFPNVKYEVTDSDFVDLVTELQSVYNTVHGLNSMLFKYQQAAQNLMSANQGLGQQAQKAYSQSHSFYETGQCVSKSHDENLPIYKSFIVRLEEVYKEFTVFFVKFDALYSKLNTRDEAFEKFKHYYRKLENMNQDRNFMIKKGIQDSITDAKDLEVIARVSSYCLISLQNEKKYAASYQEFLRLNKPMYLEIQDLVYQKYTKVTPIAMKFIKEASSFFAQMSSNYSGLRKKCRATYDQIDPLDDYQAPEESKSTKNIVPTPKFEQEPHVRFDSQPPSQQQQNFDQYPQQQQPQSRGGYNDMYERAYQEEIASKQQKPYQEAVYVQHKKNQPPQYEEEYYNTGYQQPPQVQQKQQQRRGRQQDYYDDEYYDDEEYYEEHHQNRKKKKKSGLGGVLSDMGFDKEEVAKGIFSAIFKDKK
ncbi:UNKNOWN [Stylonychia lemnae]|uniref:Uncharacterized protein n=1 Tax=Stylonychia lemnae TaxID=5949 RepID=A0A078A1T4_STYLE|nr:UNKNOWN [Stylonychia lemnae]|eukprot:CDW75423.1 UNKNOWN [Stylonychia lemnae]